MSYINSKKDYINNLLKILSTLDVSHLDEIILKNYRYDIEGLANMISNNIFPSSDVLVKILLNTQVSKLPKKSTFVFSTSMNDFDYWISKVQT